MSPAPVSSDEENGSGADIRSMIATHLKSFCVGDPGRSVALASDVHGLGLVGLGEAVPRPAASIVKLPVLMALYDKASRNELSLDDQVPVNALSGTRYASILPAFDAGRLLSLRELASLSMIVSDNPAIVHLMSLVTFSEVMDVLARCGCSDDAYISAGFTEAELGARNRGNQMTAADVVAVFEAAAAEPRYRPIMTALENNLRNNRIPAMLPDDVNVAHKTGSLAGVVNDAGIVSFGGKTFTLAVLMDGQDDPIASSREIAELSLTLSEVLLGVHCCGRSLGSPENQ